MDAHNSASNWNQPGIIRQTSTLSPHVNRFTSCTTVYSPNPASGILRDSNFQHGNQEFNSSFLHPSLNLHTSGTPQPTSKYSASRVSRAVSASPHCAPRRQHLSPRYPSNGSEASASPPLVTPSPPPLEAPEEVVRRLGSIEALLHGLNERLSTHEAATSASIQTLSVEVASARSTVPRKKPAYHTPPIVSSLRLPGSPAAPPLRRPVLASSSPVVRKSAAVRSPVASAQWPSSERVESKFTPPHRASPVRPAPSTNAAFRLHRSPPPAPTPIRADDWRSIASPQPASFQPSPRRDALLQARTQVRLNANTISPPPAATTGKEDLWRQVNRLNLIRACESLESLIRQANDKADSPSPK